MGMAVVQNPLASFLILGRFTMGFHKNRARLPILNTSLYFSYSEASTSRVQSPKGCACRQGGDAALPGERGLPPTLLQLVSQRRAAAHKLQSQSPISKFLFSLKL